GSSVGTGSKSMRFAPPSSKFSTTVVRVAMSAPRLARPRTSARMTTDVGGKYAIRGLRVPAGRGRLPQPYGCPFPEVAHALEYRSHREASCAPGPARARLASDQ